MPRGEKLFGFLAKLMVDNFYGTVTIRFEAGKATHVTAKTEQTYEYADLPVQGATDDRGNMGDLGA